MSFYLNYTIDGAALPQFDKLGFILREIPGARYLGTTLPPDIKFQWTIREIEFRKVNPPNDFHDFINRNSKKSELVCIAESVTHDAACWIDIPKQLEICRAPDNRVRHWLVVPDAHKMIVMQDNVHPSLWEKIKGWF